MTIIRSTEMQQKENSKLMEDFSHAFVSNDLNAIQELFHKDGIFLGRCTKAKALGYFHKLFFGEEGIVDYQHAYFNKGIALGISCGAEVLEIRCDKKLHFRKNGLPYFDNKHIVDEIELDTFKTSNELFKNKDKLFNILETIDKTKTKKCIYCDKEFSKNINTHF